MSCKIGNTCSPASVTQYELLFLFRDYYNFVRQVKKGYDIAAEKRL